MKALIRKRIIPWLLTVTLIVSMTGVPAYATGEGAGTAGETAAGGLCKHHPEHTDDCGYTEGTPCTHEHTDGCYEEAVICTHKHTEECYSDEYVPDTDNPASPSNLTPEDLLECDHVCDEDSGCITKLLVCPHEKGEHDESCGYSAGTPCTYECGICANEKLEETCTCDTPCVDGVVNADCPVCGAEGANLADCKGKPVQKNNKALSGYKFRWLQSGCTVTDTDNGDSTYTFTAVPEDGYQMAAFYLCDIADNSPKEYEGVTLEEQSKDESTGAWTYLITVPDDYDGEQLYFRAYATKPPKMNYPYGAIGGEATPPSEDGSVAAVEYVSRYSIDTYFTYNNASADAMFLRYEVTITDAENPDTEFGNTVTFDDSGKMHYTPAFLEGGKTVLISVCPIIGEVRADQTMDFEITVKAAPIPGRYKINLDASSGTGGVYSIWTDQKYDDNGRESDTGTNNFVWYANAFGEALNPGSFAGWFTEKNGQGQRLTDDLTITKDTTFYLYLDNTAYPVKIGGVSFAANKRTIPCGSGTATLEVGGTGSAPTYTITLKDAQIRPDSDVDGITVPRAPVTLILEGQNTIQTTGTQAKAAYGIRTLTTGTGSSLTVVGDGSLEISTNTEGIFLYYSDFELKSGSIKVTGASDAILAYSSNVTISGGGLEADNVDCGIYMLDYTKTAGSKVYQVRIDDGEVRLKADTDGIVVLNYIETQHEGIVITGGEVELEGRGEYGACCMVLNSSSSAYIGGRISISDANVTATGAESGIDTFELVTITGGIILAKGTDPDGGVGISSNQIQISDAGVTASGKKGFETTSLLVKTIDGKEAVAQYAETTEGTPLLPFTGNDGENYVGIRAYPYVRIGYKTTLTVTAQMEDRAYDGQPYAYTGTPVFTDENAGQVDDVPYTVEYEGRDGTDYPRSETAPDRIGRYNLLLTIDSDEYSGGITVPFAIFPEMTVSGTAKYGGTLAVDVRVPEGETVSYQWSRTINGMTTAISGGTGSTYELVEEDIGCTVFVTVSLPGYSDLVSNPTATVEKADAPAAPTGGIVDDAGNTFDFTPVDGTAITEYQYSADGGANWTDVTVRPIQVGNVAIASGNLQVRVRETTTRKAGGILQSSTAFTASLEGSVTISGSMSYGETLTATVTGAQDDAALHYQWKAGDAEVGTDSSTYSIQSTDIGKTIAITVTAEHFADSLTVSAATTVAKREITVTADAKTRPYGAAAPSFTYTVSGGSLVNGDILTGGLVCDTGEAAGTYAILQGTLMNDFYNITYIGADMTISRADVALEILTARQGADRDVSVTVTAKNRSDALMEDGWAQPGGVTLTGPDGNISLTDMGGGTWMGTYRIPGTATPGDKLAFTASVDDTTNNYNKPADVTGTWTVTDKGSFGLEVIADKTADVSYGDSVTYTAVLDREDTVSGSAIDGSVQFYLDGTAEENQIGSAQTVTNDMKTADITLDRTALTAGSHTIYAVYSGNEDYSGVTAQVTVEVARQTLSWDVSGLSALKRQDGGLEAKVEGSLLVSGTYSGEDAGFTYTSLTGLYDGAESGVHSVTVTVDGAAVANTNYTLPSGNPVFTGQINAVEELPFSCEPTEGTDYKVVAEIGISEVPETLKVIPDLDTPEKIKEKMKLSMEENQLFFNESEAKILDINLMSSTDGGKTWGKDSEYFSRGGVVTVNIPYSVGAGKEYKIVHMIASGDKAGSIEVLDANPSLENKTLTVTMTSMSPVAIGYRDAESTGGNSGGSSGSGSGSSSSGGSSGSGSSAAVQPGWRLGSGDYSGQWRYYNSDGSFVANSWKQILYNGTMYWYHFDADGYMETGWLKDADGSWYYLNQASDGTAGIMLTGWITDPQDQHRYYLDPATGRMLTGWQVIDGVRYYFNEQGPEQSGWYWNAEQNAWAYEDKQTNPLGMWME